MKVESMVRESNIDKAWIRRFSAPVNSHCSFNKRQPVHGDEREHATAVKWLRTCPHPAGMSFWSGTCTPNVRSVVCMDDSTFRLGSSFVLKSVSYVLNCRARQLLASWWVFVEYYSGTLSLSLCQCLCVCVCVCDSVCVWQCVCVTLCVYLIDTFPTVQFILTHTWRMLFYSPVHKPWNKL